MTTLLLVRHGEHDEVGRVLSGRSEIALNARGRAEAEAAAAMLGGRTIRSIHSSPRRRATETAAPIAACTGLAVQIAPALDEIDFGDFTGRSFAELDGDAAWQHWNAAREHARSPNGETMAAAVERAWDYLRRIPEEQSPAICVTHCDVIRGVVADRLGLRYGRMFSLACDPGSITTLAIDGDGGVLVQELNRR